MGNVICSYCRNEAADDFNDNCDQLNLEKQVNEPKMSDIVNTSRTDKSPNKPTSKVDETNTSKAIKMSLNDDTEINEEKKEREIIQEITEFNDNFDNQTPKYDLEGNNKIRAFNNEESLGNASFNKDLDVDGGTEEFDETYMLEFNRRREQEELMKMNETQQGLNMSIIEGNILKRKQSEKVGKNLNNSENKKKKKRFKKVKIKKQENLFFQNYNTEESNFESNIENANCGEESSSQTDRNVLEDFDEAEVSEEETNRRADSQLDRACLKSGETVLSPAKVELLKLGNPEKENVLSSMFHEKNHVDKIKNIASSPIKICGSASPERLSDLSISNINKELNKQIIKKRLEKAMIPKTCKVNKEYSGNFETEIYPQRLVKNNITKSHKNFLYDDNSNFQAANLKKKQSSRVVNSNNSKITSKDQINSSSSKLIDSTKARKNNQSSSNKSLKK